MKIAMYDLEGHLLEVFKVETYTELENKLGIKKTGLNAYFSNKQNQINNRQFRELHNNRVALKKIGDVSMLVNSSVQHKVVLKSYNGKLVSSYNSLPEAAKKNNLSLQLLGECIAKSVKKTLGGFEWKYVD
jgi:uncharacterized protein (UPF0210 family)